MNEHFIRLERLYRSAPIHELFEEFEFSLGTGTCEIQTSVGEGLFHGAGSLHGSIYFKLMDDSAYFAAMTVEKEYFIVTTQASIQLLRPVIAGDIIAKSRLIAQKEKEYTAEAELWSRNKLVGKGQFEFRRSKKALSEIEAYASPL